MSKKVLVFVTGIALIAAFAAGTYFYQKQQTEKMQFAANQNFEMFVRPHSPIYGDQTAKVYVVEFLDPECEACRMMNPYVKELMEIYKGKIQLIVRHAPFHANSRKAIAILFAAKMQDKYWEVLDIMYKYQPIWGDHHNPQPELLWTYLPEAGVDIEKLKIDLEDPAIVNFMARDLEDLKKLNVRQTPTFFVNGSPLMKFGPQFLRELIDAEVKAAY